MNAKTILSSGAFWPVNKNLTKQLNDIQSVVLLTYLIDKESYHSIRNELLLKNDKLWFFAISSEIERATTLSYKQQKRCLKIISSKDLISQMLIGVPARLHFNINHIKICHLVTTSIDQMAILDVTKGNTIVITEDKEHSNNNTYSKKTEFETAIEESIDRNLKEKSSAKKESEPKLPMEELRVQSTIKKVHAYFEKWPAMKHLLLENARIDELKEEGFDFNEQIEAWVRHNSNNPTFCYDPGKQIPKSFQAWLKRYHQFKPKPKTSLNGKAIKKSTDQAKNYNYGSDQNNW